MYDPTIGRWISEDPIGFEAADPNLYRYAGNNSVGFTDPSGLFRTGSNTPRGLHHYIGDAAGDYTVGIVVGMFVDRFGRDRLLRGIPRILPNTLPRTPADWTVVDVVGGQHKWGPVPARTLLGPNGTQTSLGLILVPTQQTITAPSGVMVPAGTVVRLETYAYHFSAIDNVNATLGSAFLFANSPIATLAAGYYRAVLCGARGSTDPGQAYETGRMLSQAISSLAAAGIPILGYVAGPNAHVDEDGTLYWTAPPETATDGY